MTEKRADLHRREAEFHDQWAAATTAASVRVTAAFEASTAPENRFILESMGDLRGVRILDLGAGLGECSVYFALHGADVTMADLSREMVEVATNLGKHYGVKMSAIVGPAETIGAPSDSFDVVYMSNLIHHVENRDELFRTVRRVLKPGGRFFSWDPLAYNPVINVYRRMATEVRTADESPLTFADLALARRHFVDVGHREFWIFSLVLFLKYYLIDRVHPNEGRYWKRVLEEPEERLGWFRALQRIDSVVTRVPFIRRLAWNMVMWGTKPHGGD
jgi:SAM-dependent methyltransferase